jgi:UDP-N-acetylmuramate--alanine ligase
LLLEVYSAGESPIPGADSRTLCRSIRQRGRVDPIFIEQNDDLPKGLWDILQDGDIVLTQGAGNIGSIAARLGETLQLLGRAGC